MGRPKLLSLDEPTEGVQPNVVKQIESVIALLKGRIRILPVEQYYDFARTLADNCVVLERGAVADSDLSKLSLEGQRKSASSLLFCRIVVQKPVAFFWKSCLGADMERDRVSQFFSI